MNTQIIEEDLTFLDEQYEGQPEELLEIAVELNKINYLTRLGDESRSTQE